ncbi:hypothetical protein Dimus_037982 [Dionaea muscipula]
MPSCAEPSPLPLRGSLDGVLQPRTISWFSQLKNSFVGQFASSCTFSRAAPSLFSVRQRTDKSLRDIMSRFNKAYIQIPSLGGDVAMVALQTGLRSGAFLDDLTLRKPEDFEQLLQRAQDYMTLDSSRTSRQEPRKETESRSIDKRCRKSSHRSNTRPSRVSNPPWVAERGQVLAAQSNRGYVKAPVNKPTPRAIPQEKKRWCSFHKECAHDSRDCRVLRRQAEGDSQREHTRQSDHPPKDNCKPSFFGRKDSNRSPSPDRKRSRITVSGAPIIHTISGGPSNGGDSARGRKKYARGEWVSSIAVMPKSKGKEKEEQQDVSLTFSQRDEVGVSYPRQDTVLITAMNKDVEVRQILVDTGSSGVGWPVISMASTKGNS